MCVKRATTSSGLVLKACLRGFKSYQAWQHHLHTAAHRGDIALRLMVFISSLYLILTRTRLPVCVCVQTKEEVLEYSKQHKAVSDAANEVFTHRTGNRVVDKHFLVLVQAKQAALNSPPKLPGKQHKVRSRSNESRRVRSFTLMFGVDWLIAESQACG